MSKRGQTIVVFAFIAIGVLAFAWYGAKGTVVRRYRANGTLHSEGRISNATRNGVWTYYHSNGRLKMRGEWKHGRKTGTWLSYNSNGMFRKREHFTNGSRSNRIKAVPGR